MECERLQSFPDGWTAGISDTARYRCLGNAVTVNVVEAIAEKILISLTNQSLLDEVIDVDHVDYWL
jgi:site-specific DNA-cytosine methylase